MSDTNFVKQVKSVLIFTLFLLLAVGCTSNSKKRKKHVPINSASDVLTNLMPQTETFEIMINEENLIKGEKGTVIYIPNDAFQFVDGSIPNGKINLELKECYSVSDIIAENLSTVSNGQILQTAGMINIKARANGKELFLKDGKAFVVGFPKAQQADTMDLFYDFKDNKGNTTWIADYKMFEAEAMLEAQKDTLPNKGYDSLSIKYPIEITEDMYDYGFCYVAWSGTFFDLKLKGQDKTIMDYIDDPANISDSIAQQFIENKWRVHYYFNIDKNGSMYNFRVSKTEDYTRYNTYALKITADFLRKAPPFDLASYKEKFNYDGDYLLGISGTKKINWGKFKAKFREKFAEYKNNAIQKLDKTALDYYMFSVTKFGWINCDKFWDTKDEKIDFIVKTKNAKDAKVQLVFADINSIMNGVLKDDQYVFSNIPINSKVKIIGISYMNGQPTMSSLQTQIDKDGAELTAFKEFSLNELEIELNKKN